LHDQEEELPLWGYAGEEDWDPEEQKSEEAQVSVSEPWR
jgi:hypothetical protein